MTTTSSSTLQRDWNPGDLWEGYQATSLLEIPELAQATGVSKVFIKNEVERPLGNFKVLGGMVAAFKAMKRRADAYLSSNDGAVPLPHLVCASDGNHGLAVASAAQHMGVSATVYLPACASPLRIERIRTVGGRVVLVEGTYDDAVLAARTAASHEDGLLIPDTTSDPLDPVVLDVMRGYGQMTEELTAQFASQGDIRPTHAFIQAGVGGLAAAVATGLQINGLAPIRIVVVEPRNAACVAHALQQGRPVRIAGSLGTTAEMLSCGLASAPALDVLLEHRARSLLVDEVELQAGPSASLATTGLASTPSGAAGLAGFLVAAANPEKRREYGLDPNSVVLLFNTEGAVEDQKPTSH
ncbi:pyridoxal-phosphate dependent enzyme [Flavobacterium sp. MXW15]|uniref:Pyridoxal-phosphate dependent enzyme n=1 Tax=Xanthomonas chitinilytica TaxID=2989819 RepID=A0ABT3K0N4_9XANT|nr:pyridoxal-phosphate dependent enzyme [Xanthomonas sp. H13-6]MCW4456593.1 pyridoxal-phosphate dependent enzyme [Flavobacterium sp. MXW15]MCW4474295.1 pyridoxal-phosphate dependent enzyme [Xanthomonas sp. H13-6]